MLSAPQSPPLPPQCHSILEDPDGNIAAEHKPPLPPYIRENNSGDHSVIANLWSPANIICYPTEPSQGYGRLRHLDRIKREQYIYNAHEPLVVKWDMIDFSSIVEVLEACGNSTQKVHKPWMNAQDKRDAQVAMSADGNLQKPLQDQQSKFDPRAPHFDVILVDLTNAPASRYQSASVRKDIGKNTASDSGSELNLSAKKREPNSLKDQCSLSAHSISELSPNKFREDINNLPMESLAGRPGWLFLWVGITENMVEGRRILAKFGFRKVECIGWVKTTKGGWEKIETNQSNDNIQYSSEPTGRSVLRRGIEWCLVGVKGTAKRTYDSHLIHCNLSTDVIISDGPKAPKSSLLSKIIENFSQGQRRLHLFASPGDERAGWVCVGKDFEETTFDCKKYMKFWDDRGKHGWLMPFDPEIEYFRPKTPPLQVRKRERTGLKKSSRGGNIRARWEDEPPKYPHPGQRKRPNVRYFYPEDDPKFQRRTVTTAVTMGQNYAMPKDGNGLKHAMGSRVVQLSHARSMPRVNSHHYKNHQNPHHNQSQNLQQRRASEPLLKLPEPKKKFRPSPTAKLFLPEVASQKDPKIADESGSLEHDSQPDHSHVAEKLLSGFSEYSYQPSGQLPKDIPKVPSFPSTPSTPPPEEPYKMYLRQNHPLPFRPGYSSTGPSSLSSQFGALSMYSDSHQSESPTLHSNYLPDNTQRNFPPVFFPLGEHGRIKTANEARLATFPPVFRTEYRQSQRQPGLPYGYYGNMDSVTTMNMVYPQRPFDQPGGYGSTNRIEFDDNLNNRIPSQHQAPHYQQLAVCNTPLVDHPNQGLSHQNLQGPQDGGYPSDYGQPHQQPQLQQIPSTQHPRHESHLHMQNQQQQQQQQQLTQFKKYNSYELQDQQQQSNMLQNMRFLGSQADYESQIMMAGTQRPTTSL